MIPLRRSGRSQPAVGGSEPGTDEQLRQLVTSLHAFVDLVDVVRSRRIRGLGLVVALNLADVATTSWFLALGVMEGNPLLAPIAHHWWAVLAIKTAIVVLLARRVLAASPRSTESTWLVNLSLAYYVLVVGWNVHVIGQALR